jgi:arsenate reductase
MEIEIMENEMLFIYNSNSMEDKVALGYVKPTTKYKVKEFNVSQETFTELQLKEIADRLEVEPKDLMDTKSSIYKDKYATTNLSQQDVLVALKHEPDLMRTPIALYQNEGHFVDSKYEFMKKDMDYGEGKASKANREEKD